MYPLDNNREKSVVLPAGVSLDNPLSSPHLVRDFVERGVESMTYSILAVQEAKVQSTLRHSTAEMTRRYVRQRDKGEVAMALADVMLRSA